MLQKLKKCFWKLPIPSRYKIAISDLYHALHKELPASENIETSDLIGSTLAKDYIKQILNLPNNRSPLYKEYQEHPFINNKAKVIAYYLTQFHPTEKNNLWWGKGTTEWTNVTKTVPQFVGHSQPKLPADLGFYDLRLIENIEEQVKIAKNYGVSGFCFYYYWFNGERALELPLNLFLNSPERLKIDFCICWCNEDWTKRYSGTSNEVLLSVGKTEASYYRFIEDIIPMLKDPRYITVDNKPVLIIYRPSQIPNPQKILNNWRSTVKSTTGQDLYLIASQENNVDVDWTKQGFDAISQFQPASIMPELKEIHDLQFVRNDFKGKVYSYPDIVDNNIGIKVCKHKKIYPAVMPAWDNTSRRNEFATIFKDSSPLEYKRWLKNAIDFTTNNKYTEENFIFINAWNEWGEGAYLEPDREFGYAYLEETFNALNEN